ncbi:MAG: hypothetical protein HPY84_15920 [Syntrophobacteraceae bacterium]|nr:hypothetical protein [Syntrophobacteraceae bacterium]
MRSPALRQDIEVKSDDTERPWIHVSHPTHGEGAGWFNRPAEHRTVSSIK